MSLGNAISAALSGLRATQTGVGLIADNIANADTPGYVRKSVIQTTTAAGSGGGVRVVGVQRELDIFVQRQLRAELSGASYADKISSYYGRIEQVYGRPGGINALDTLFNNFTNSLQALVTSPESVSGRTQVLNEAAVLAQHLNAMSADIQALRSEAEFAIAGSVQRVNEILTQIEEISNRIIGANQASAEIASLHDTRDTLIAELATLVDIQTVDAADGQIAIFTTSGVSLFDRKAARLEFDGRDNLNALAFWDSDPTKRNVGTITLTSPNGYQVDLVADKSLRSGTIAAHLEMRDKTLVEAQAQLDEIAHSLALALSNRTVAGTPVSGPPDGFSLDLTQLLSGNTITLTYTDNVAGQQQRVTIVRVDDAGALPLGDNFTPDPNDTVIGVDFSGGMAAVVTALNTALSSTGLVFSNPAGNTLSVVDDGVPDLWDVDGFDASITTSTFNSGDPSIPFFVDGGTSTLYTNFVVADGMQKTGFAARIALNAQLRDDPARLVEYAAGTPAGDPTRPNYLEQQLSAAIRFFSPASGVGTTAGPYSGSIVDFIRQSISMQGANAEGASRLKEGQDIVLNALQTRYNERASVNVDTEMANLLVLQTAYGANARVLATVKEMLEALMQI
ncbi:MAG TPA: flagellar hook-associated protein FlgK [Xanthobacteraceae bacterium]|jgi:flagellar hook-associated protein 1 FlgK